MVSNGGQTPVVAHAASPGRYAAFISYSRTADEHLGPALEEALERFAKPWNRLRALRVFRDDADLSANSGLWGSITAALDDADYLILLASPAAKESKWVGREVEHWRAHRDVNHLLLVATEGEIVWDEEVDDFDWTRTTAVPDALRGAFAEEPRYTDLRWARDPDLLTLDNDRFRGAVADLAGTLHGRPKDEMIGEQVRQHRRTIRLARGAIVALSILALGATLAAALAVWQSRVATDQRDAARSRELATRALAQLAVDPTESVRLAAQAVELKPLPEAEQALRAALAESQLGAFAVLRGHRGPLSRVDIDPAGRRVVTGSGDGTARLWDAASGATIAVLRGEGTYVRDVAFDPSGTRVVTAGGDTARLWNAATGKVEHVLRGQQGYVWTAAFDAHGTQVVTAGEDGTARVWDAATGKRLAVLRGHKVFVVSAVFDRAGKRVVTASVDYTARVWNAATGVSQAVLRGHRGALTSAAFNPAGTRVVTGGDDGTARIWDAASGKPLVVLRGHRGDVSAEFDQTGTRVVTVGEDGMARIWNAANGKLLVSVRARGGVAILDPEGKRVLATSAGGSAQLSDAASGEAIAVLRGHENTVTDAAFDLSGNRLVTASADGTARVWDVTPRKDLGVLPERYVSSAAFDVEGRRLVTGSADGTARIWDVATWRRLAVVHGHRGPVTVATFDRDARQTVAEGTDDAISGDSSKRVRGNVLAMDPDGKLVVTSGEKSTARVWDLAEGKVIAVLRGHSEAESSPYAVGVSHAAFDPEGERVVTVGLDGTARVWEAETGKRLAVLRGHGNIVHSAAFDPTGKRILTTGQEGTAHVWEAATGRTVAVLPAGLNAQAAFDPNGKVVLTISANGPARIWDAASGRALAVLVRDDDRPIETVALSPSGKLIVIVAKDGTARLYSCRACGTIDDLLAEAVDYRRGRRAPTSLGGDAAAWRAPVFSQVTALLTENYGVDEAAISEDALLEEDLGMDWLARLEMYLELEDLFGIKISDEKLETIETVGEVVDHFRASGR